MEADSGVLLVYTGIFLVYSAMEFLGLMPQEVKSAGLTLPALFSKLYGDIVGWYFLSYLLSTYSCHNYRI